ncbi:MAG TPA: tRNA (adenosine(37)-N6)-threonylcarbamoyltransferase complex ATPase subunit type 1 TsaE [Oculatellaceae cyanobacterium]|jgi:tRNA threonylcarbamoyladenosine biosynthesis protein TsaE
MVKNSQKISLKDQTVTHKLGLLLGKFLPTGSTILLQGDLGSGKTTLVQGIGEGLEIKELIVSPTFTLINEYTSGRIPLYHLDLYRLEPEDLTELHIENYWEAIEVPAGIVAIEWAERLVEKPLNYLHIYLTYQQQEGRIAEIVAIGECELIDLSDE